MLMLIAAYGYWVGNRWYRAISLLILAGWIMALSRCGYRTLHTSVAGIDQIAMGMACLLLGLMVSLWKIGIPQAWWAWWLKPGPIPVVPTAETGGAERRDEEV